MVTVYMLAAHFGSNRCGGLLCYQVCWQGVLKGEQKVISEGFSLVVQVTPFCKPTFKSSLDVKESAPRVSDRELSPQAGGLGQDRCFTSRYSVSHV